MTVKVSDNAAFVNDEQIESLLKVLKMYTVIIAEKIRNFHILGYLNCYDLSEFVIESILKKI